MLALAYVDERLFDAGIDGGPVAWLHDEIVLEVREIQAERAAEILKQSMTDGFFETFPWRAAPRVGRSAHRPELGCGETRSSAAAAQTSPQQEAPDYGLAHRARLKELGDDASRMSFDFVRSKPWSTSTAVIIPRPTSILPRPRCWPPSAERPRHEATSA